MKSKIMFDRKNVKILGDAFPLLINNEYLADIKFQFDDGVTIFAHSFVLCVRSEEFSKHFEASFGVLKIIKITDFSSELFLVFMKYLYTDQIESETYHSGLMSLAKKYKIESLEEKCESHLSENISSENACRILENAIMNKLEDIRKLTLDYISNNYLEVLKSKLFLESDQTILKSILELDPVSEVDEFKIFESVVNWTTKACEKDGCELTGLNRRKMLKDAVFLIRFASMTNDEFIKCQQMASDLLNSSESLAIFINIGTKKLNDAGFSDQKRIFKIRNVEFDDEVILFARPFRSVTIQNHSHDQLEDAFFMEFEVSKSVWLNAIKFDLFMLDCTIEFNVFENSSLINSEDLILFSPDAKTIHLGNLTKISPILLNPNKHYRIEYSIKECSKKQTVTGKIYIVKHVKRCITSSNNIDFWIYNSYSHIISIQ